ncbi:hypothetical protein ASE21_11800 [Flavobacterium sp. Root901]|uniref:hypothetical protein n=1 Tax=Flavobacterium sp. Root901 TaxID=1736605 RepID=UPI00070F169E|nr:hypothetical protein [Flavobacterium sp. Root901]KRD10385.1 hypothetical protein ASE21_11800 [Flavobacterium sp. Root901]
MGYFSEKKPTQHKPAVAQNQITKKTAPLTDNRPVSVVQQKLSENIQKNPFPIVMQRKTQDDTDEEISDEPVQMKSSNVPQTHHVIQLGISKNNTAKKSKNNQQKSRRRQKLEYEMNPAKEYLDIKNAIDQKIVAAYKYIKKVKEQLDDDADVNLINTYSNRFTKISKKARLTVREIQKLPPAPRRALRSQTTDRDLLMAKLNGYSNLVTKVKWELVQVFPMNKGGFGAKGRAHNMETEVNPSTVPNDKTLNNHYFNNITLDGKTSAVKVYKKTATAPNQASGPLQIMGQNYTNQPLSTTDKAKLQKKLDKNLANINIPQNAVFTNTPVGRDRGDGQYKSMGNTNAAGYAWLLNRLGGQRWEWLHIRGAGLGGMTDSTNLVAGTRDANTHMIPFESNIRHLGTAVKNSNKYSRLSVTWSAFGQIAKYAYSKITISWTLFKKGGGKKATGYVSFDPLDTSNNISKNEVDKIEEILTDIRQGL